MQGAVEETEVVLSVLETDYGPSQDPSSLGEPGVKPQTFHAQARRCTIFDKAPHLVEAHLPSGPLLWILDEAFSAGYVDRATRKGPGALTCPLLRLVGNYPNLYAPR